MMNLNASRLCPPVHVGRRRVTADHPMEQTQRYLADGNRCTRYDDGHMPAIAFVYVIIHQPRYICTRIVGNVTHPDWENRSCPGIRLALQAQIFS